MSFLKEVQAEMASLRSALIRMTERVVSMESLCEVAEHRLRRNGPFYGHPYTENETWVSFKLLKLKCVPESLVST